MAGAAADFDVIFFIHFKDNIGSDETSDQGSKFPCRRGRRAALFNHRLQTGGNADFQIRRRQCETALFRLDQHIPENRKHRTRPDDASHPLQRLLQFLTVYSKLHLDSLQSLIRSL